MNGASSLDIRTPEGISFSVPLAGPVARLLAFSMGASFHPSRDVGEASDLLRLAERAMARAREEGPGHTCFCRTEFPFVE